MARVNEYGTPLDRNGYAPSILYNPHCYDEENNVYQCPICGQIRPCQRHEPFGASNRQKSKEFGMWIYLCDDCHHRAHRNSWKLNTRLKADTQVRAQKVYGWTDEEFIKRFGKNFKEE